MQRPANGCTLAPIPTKLPAAPHRLVAIGDLHGDMTGAYAALRAAGAIASPGSAGARSTAEGSAESIDEDSHWIGGDLVIVQTGDVLDRGDDESKILELLERLDGEARKAGGAIIRLNGNHELMNAAHDFRYVTPGGMHDFGGDREHALAPGGSWAKKFAAHNVVAIVGDTVFSHAGVLPEWASHVDELNLSTRCWLDGQLGGAGSPPQALTAENSPVWTRDYGLAEKQDCAEVDAALTALGANRMVVGHTVQQGSINTGCDGKLWRIDVGLAALYGGPIQVLEVAGGPNDPQILFGARK